MNSDLVEFYYLTKHASSISSREKEELENKQDEKIANNFRQIASTFAKNHPKAVESAITGGILGAGSELVMPANKDMMGNPSTNLGEIGKRALLGATLGGIGGEVKTQVRNHVLPKIAQEDIEKVAGKFDKLKQFAKENPITLGGLGLGTATGGYAGYKRPDLFNAPKENHILPDKVRGAINGGIFGGVVGGSIGRVGNSIRNSHIEKITPQVLSKNFEPSSGTKKIPHKEIKKTAGALDLLKSIPNSVRNNVAVRGVAEAGKQLAPSSLLQTAGKYMAKSPTLGGAAIGAGAGLAGNFLSGEDHALGSALAGAGAGALGGKALLKGNVSKTNPLFGQSFGTGVRNELKAGLKAKPVVSSPITSPSLQNAPSLNSLVNDAKGAKPVVAPTMPKRPESIEW